MSALLESLLDAERQRQCAEHDHLSPNPPKDTAMKHAIKPSRVYADMQAKSEAIAPSEFDITVIRFGRPDQPYHGTFQSPADAYMDGFKKGGDGSVVIVKPVGGAEQTYWSAV